MILRRPQKAFLSLALAICLLSALFSCALGETTSMEAAEVTDASDADASFEEIYPGLQMSATLGYDGLIVYLRQLPLRVTLKNEGADFSGVLGMKVNRDGMKYDRYEMPVFVAKNATVEVTLPVMLSKKQAKYNLELRVDGQEVASREFLPNRVLDPKIILVGTLGGRSLTHFHVTSTRDPLKRGETWQTIPLTEKTFPRDSKMLKGFAVLVVDGFDARILDEQQQAVLEVWLKDGGILILGGAAQAGAGYPYFTQYNDITAGALSQSEDVTPVILSHLKLVEKPFDDDMMLAEMKGAKNVALANEELPLLDVAPVGNGYVITAAFSLSDRPLIAWQGNLVLWQRLLIDLIGSRYQEMVEEHRNQNYFFSYDYSDSSIGYSIAVPNEASLALPLTLMFLFLGMVGFGSYWFLQKKDKREWLWLTIPVLSVTVLLCFWWISHHTLLNQPIVVLSDFVDQSVDGTVTERADIHVATAESGRLTLSSKHGEVTASLSDHYYYEEIPSQKDPDQLQFVYSYGSESSFNFPEASPWEVRRAVFTPKEKIPFQVDGKCWFEEDGLYIRLENKSDFPLQPGHIVTSYGYCSVEALLPGQSKDYLIKRQKEDIKNPLLPNGNGNLPILDGVMLRRAQQTDMSWYEILRATVYPKEWQDDKTVYRREDSPETTLRLSLYEKVYSRLYSRWGAIYLYVTLDDSLCDVEFLLNGKPALRTAQKNVLTAALAYQPVSENGFVNYGVGSVPVYQATEKDNHEPVRGVAIQERHRYFRLVEQPMFCFVLNPDMQKIKISEMDILLQYIYGDYENLVYNHKTKEWDTLDLLKPMKEQIDLTKHMNGEGEIFVQYRPKSSEPYAEMGTPFMMIEGRMP